MTTYVYIFFIHYRDETRDYDKNKDWYVITNYIYIYLSDVKSWRSINTSRGTSRLNINFLWKGDSAIRRVVLYLASSTATVKEPQCLDIITFSSSINGNHLFKEHNFWVSLSSKQSKALLVHQSIWCHCHIKVYMCDRYTYLTNLSSQLHKDSIASRSN